MLYGAVQHQKSAGNLCQQPQTTLYSLNYIESIDSSSWQWENVIDADICYKGTCTAVYNCCFHQSLSKNDSREKLSVLILAVQI